MSGDPKCFYHLTHKKNLASIVKYGLFSRERLNGFEDIANSDVVDYRRIKKDRVYYKTLTSYVPLFFNPRNPMLYSKRENQHELLILKVSTKVLGNERALFTNGNAASKISKFYKGGVNYLSEVNEKIDWVSILAEYWNDDEDGKRKRCAEILVPDNVEKKFIKGVIVSNRKLEKQISGTLPIYWPLYLDSDCEYFFK